jgi:hypothetical protein
MPFEVRSANTSPELRPFLFDSGWRAHAMAGFPRAPDSPQIPDPPAAFLDSAGGDLKERNRQLANRGAPNRYILRLRFVADRGCIIQWA